MVKRGKQKKKSKAPLIAGIAAGAVVVLGAGAVVGGGFYARSLDTVFPNVNAAGTEIGGLTRAEATAKLEAACEELREEMTARVNVSDVCTVTVTAEDAGYVLDPYALADKVLLYGRDCNVAESFLRWAGQTGAEFDPTDFANYDEERVRVCVEKQIGEISTEALDPAYVVEKDQIVITKGSRGASVDENVICELIRQQFLAKNFTTADYEAEVIVGKELNLKTIYDKVFTEPVDAAVDPKTGKTLPAADGISFDLKAAQALYDGAKDGEKVVIPLIRTPAKVQEAEVEDLYFRDVLSECTTTMYTSTNDRITNITLTANAINGVILNPGDVFSFNDTCGERTAERGYKTAGAYVGGKHIDQYGGGICQTSSTLYVCVLHADLEVVHRENHMYQVSYLPMGQDATVDWNNIDFKFKNNTEYPIRIEAGVEDAELTVRLWGTKVDDGYIEIVNDIVDYTPCTTIFREDPNVTEEIEDTEGYDGYEVDTYKRWYDADGNLLREEFLYRDIYECCDQVILVPAGGGSAEEEPEDEPEDEPEEEPEDEPSEDPQVTEEPEPSEDPEVTEDPEITEEPENTEEPEEGGEEDPEVTAVG